MFADDLKDDIRVAFRGVPQPRLLTLSVAEVHDNWDYENDEQHAEQMRVCARFVRWCADNDPLDEIDVDSSNQVYKRYWYQYG